MDNVLYEKATFPKDVPNPSIVDAQPSVRLLIAKFGDGYEQRTPDGLNHIQNIFRLTWELLEQKYAETILNFLNIKQKGYKPFEWQDPVNKEKKYNVVCKEWQYQISGKAHYRIEAVFDVVFDL